MSWSSASSSSAATLSTAPARACIRAPPSSSLSGVSPMPGHRHDRRAGHEQLRGVPDDHREVRADHARGAEPGHRPERRGRHRHDREVLHHEVEAGQRRHVREAHLLERLDAAAAARAVHEPDERQPQVVRHALGVDGLLPDRGVGGAAADGEVVALHDRAAAVDASLADDRVRGQELASARRRRRRSPRPASAPVSWNVPSSNSRSIRSRTVSRPDACWRSTRSSPPIRRASSSRRRSSSSSGSQDTAAHA